MSDFNKKDTEMLKNKSIFNCEGLDILPYLQGNTLAFHIFMDAGRRHRKLGLRTLFLMATQAAWAACVHCFHLVPRPTGWSREAQGILHMQ